MKPTAIKSLAHAVLDHWEAIATEIDSGFQVSGEEVRLLNPRRDDRTRNSFSFNRRTGVWKDFAIDRGGGDLVGLWAYFRGFDGQGRAAENLASFLGLDSSVLGQAPRRLNVSGPLRAVPLEAEDAISTFTSWAVDHRHMTAIWQIRDAEGHLLGLRVRTDDPIKGKAILPFSWNAAERQWRQGGAFTRLFYRLQYLREFPLSPVLVVEGEKTAEAAATLFPNHVVLGLMGSGASRQVDIEPLQGRRVDLWPDADSAGITAMRTLAARLHEFRCVVRIVELPEKIMDWMKPGKTEPGGWDLADPAPAGLSEMDLHALLGKASPFPDPKQKADGSPSQPPRSQAGPYRVESGRIVMDKMDRSGQVTPFALCNFAAIITEEIACDDGVITHTHFVLEGTLESGEPLKPIKVPSKHFSAMSWVIDEWGSRAIISAGPTTKDHLRNAIQRLSHGRTSCRTIYSHLGWRKIDGAMVYLCPGHSIGTYGSVDEVEVDTSDVFHMYQLPVPPEGERLRDCIRASVALMEVMPDAVSVPVWLSIYRAPLGSADFSLHLAGRTQNGKSVMQSLAQAHWGPGFHEKNLPATWISTGNALELIAFLAGDALLCVDDFTPEGSKQDQSRLHSTASRLFRAQGNGAGRARLTEASSLKAVRPPRGLILSSGEDLPLAQSVKGRCLILETEKTMMQWDRVTELQKKARAGLLAESMSGYLQWLAPLIESIQANMREHLDGLRVRFRMGANAKRTVDQAASLFMGWETFRAFAAEADALSDQELDVLEARVLKALSEAAETQAETQATSDPVTRAPGLLTSLFSSGRGHVQGPQGRCPARAECLGWSRPTKNNDGSLEPQGPCIGYVDPDHDLIFLDPTAAYAALLALSEAEGERMPLSQSTFWKRVAERGWLARGDGKNLARKAPKWAPLNRGMALHASVILRNDPDETSEQLNEGAGTRSAETPGNIEPMCSIRPFRPLDTLPIPPGESVVGQDWLRKKPGR